MKKLFVIRLTFTSLHMYARHRSPSHLFSNLIHRCMQYVEFVVLNLAVIVNTVIVYGKYIIIIIKLSNLTIYIQFTHSNCKIWNILTFFIIKMINLFSRNPNLKCTLRESRFPLPDWECISD